MEAYRAAGAEACAACPPAPVQVSRSLVKFTVLARSLGPSHSTRSQHARVLTSLHLARLSPRHAPHIPFPLLSIPLCSR